MNLSHPPPHRVPEESLRAAWSIAIDETLRVQENLKIDLVVLETDFEARVLWQPIQQLLELHVVARDPVEGSYGSKGPNANLEPI